MAMHIDRIHSIAVQLCQEALEEYDFAGALANKEHEGLVVSAHDAEAILRWTKIVSESIGQRD